MPATTDLLRRFLHARSGAVGHFQWATLADAVGVSRSAMSSYLNGRANMPRRIESAIIRELQLDDAAELELGRLLRLVADDLVEVSQ